MAEKISLPRTINKIILTLENCLLPETKLELTPSQNDGMNRETEIDLRILGCELIQTAGILLRLPQVAMATGQVLFQRFFYSKSFVNHNMEITAMSCICLASKIEEAPRCFRDVINVFHHVKQVRAQKNITPVVLDASYISLKNQVIKAERSVLKILGFCVHVKHPHKLIVIYLQVLGYEKNQKLMQMAWNFMNDSLRTDVFVRHPPETIACACIYLTIRKLNIAFPMNPPWFGVFKVSENDIIDVSYRILELYRRSKPNAEQLEQAVIELKRKNANAKEKPNAAQMIAGATTKAAMMTAVASAAAVATTGATTTADRNNGSHNAWGGFLSRTLPITDQIPMGGDNINNRIETNKHHQHHSKSKSPRSRTMSPIDDQQHQHQQRSRTAKKRSKRSKTPQKYSKSNKSRYYSRSPSSSPHAKHKKRYAYEYWRKKHDCLRTRSDHRDSKSEYYSNGGDRADRNMIKERLTGSGGGGGGGGGGSDRPRERDRESGIGGDGGDRGGGGRARSKERLRDKDRSSGKHDRYRNSHRSTKHRDRSRDRSRDRKR